MFRDQVQRYLATTTLEPYRMEQVFSYAYMDAQYHELCVKKEGTAERLLRAWQQSAGFLEALIHELRLALAVTTNPLLCGPSEGALGPILRHVLEECAGDLTILTFNQDLLIERALEELHHANGHTTPYRFPGLYGLAFDRVASGSEGLHKLGQFSPCRKGPEGFVLKLHGSFNWFISQEASGLVDQSPSLYSTLFQQGGQTLCVNARELLMDGRTSIRKGHTGFDRWLPLVVPPVATKTTWLDSPLWPLWKRAE